jgi:hypothetical protein
LAPLVLRLRAWGLNGLAAALLEQGGPVSLLGAQVLYAAAPALRLFTAGDPATRLAQILDDPDASRALARSLNEANR